MDSFFPSAKLYNPNGQNYVPVDHQLMLTYTESPEGQIVHVGINEAGATAAFTAIGTSYDTHGEPMIPIYIFYSMFGFQRTGDGFWAAPTRCAAASLSVQLQVVPPWPVRVCSTLTVTPRSWRPPTPAFKIYDPAYGYEIAHIVERGIEQMYGTKDEDHNVMYYLTVYNEPIHQPAEPANVDVEASSRVSTRSASPR